MSPTKEIPWKKINEYLLQIEAVTDRSELMRVSLLCAADLVDCDSGLGFHDCATGYCVTGLGLSDDTITSYNSYYGALFPFAPHADFAGGLFHFSGSDAWNSEFVQDFCRPNGFGYGVGAFEANMAARIIYSSTCRFGAELDGALILNRHVDVLYKRLADPTPASLNLTLVEFMDRHKLTRREAEVFDLILSGYPAALIATRLVISPRTVEKHIASIYSKIGVTNRRHLRILVDRFRPQ